MSTKRILFVLSIVMVTGSCQKKAPYEEMAQAMCDCMRPMTDLYKKVQDLSTSGNTDELMTLMNEMEQVAADAEACTNRMEIKFGEPEDEEKANEALKRICPDVSAVIQQMDAGLE